MERNRLLTRLGLSLFVVVFFAGCQTEPQSTLGAQQPLVKRPSVTVASYLQQAQYAVGDEKVTLLLQAAGAALANGNEQQAKKLLRQLSNQALTQPEALQLQLLEAELLLVENKPEQAKSILLRAQEAAHVGLGERRHRLLMQAYQALGQTLMAIRTETDLLKDISDRNERNLQMMALWDQLSAQPESQLEQWLEQVPAQSSLAGWLRLARIMRSDEVASSPWYRDLAQWQQRFPNHPAMVLIPVTPTQVAPAKRRIALLLPLTGPHAAQGEAVRRGFYAAYFQQCEKQAAQPTLQVFDTNEAPMDTLLQRIREQRMTEMVGPLLKTNLEALLDEPSPEIPVLALNSVPQQAPGVLQFSLAPESTVDQLAAGMAAAKHWRVVVLAPNNANGERLLQRFRFDWQQYHGDMVGVFRYGEASGYASGIQQLLNIDQANARKEHLQQVVGGKLRFVADRRDDIDAILLIGDRTAGQLLKPLLNFYFAGDLPVYTTSELVDKPGNNPRLADLNGLQFLAMPWQVVPVAKMPWPIGQIRAQLQQTWPSSTDKYAKFYAMGVDAYFVMQRISALQTMPNLSYFGETGLLAVDMNNRIYPRLLWAKLTQGKAQLLNHG